MSTYDYKNCQSLFGYAAEVHVRSRGQCQLCLCGGPPLDFHLWRQMTVEHLVGESQGGYLKQIRAAVSARFPGFPAEAQESIARRIDIDNTVTACSFCNSTTSRDINEKSIYGMLHEVQGDVEQVMAHVHRELTSILERKRKDVQWKLASVMEAFEREVRAKITGAGS